MMRIGNTFFIAIGIGALWGAIYIVVFSVLGMLISGEALVPDMGTAAISAAVGAVCYILHPPFTRSWYWACVTAYLIS